MKLKLGNFFNLDNLDSSIEAVGETRELAELLKDQNISTIAPWISNVAPFLKPLASPEIQLASELSEAILPFIKIASSFVKYISKRKEPTTFSQCVVLVCFQAFLESLYKNSKGISISSKRSVPIAKNIKDAEITEDDAKNALKFFPQSKLSEIFKETIKTRLLQASLDEEVINLLLEKATWGADPYISYLWSDLPEEVRKFSNISISEWKKENSQDLESDIEKVISEETRKVLPGFTKPEISLGQIYTQLEVEEIDSNGKISAGQRPISSHSWVNKILLAGELTKPILIQGDSGQGKSSFCSMYFREVYRELYPAYIPVLINLREIEDVKETLTKTFEGCLEFRFPSLLRNRQWLSDPTKRYGSSDIIVISLSNQESKL
ncbi:MAG: hypothetical protein ACTS2F_30070, partial [Thainema sp.]